MTEPLCFQCKHFKQYQPLHFVTPGECKWEPANQTPPWFDLWFDSREQYYGPHREVSTRYCVITQCNAFQEKTDAKV
jgi:hypothetical protein